jgi:HSP20 family protein
MSKLVKYDPFAEINALQRQFFGNDMIVPFSELHIPTTDVYTKDNKLIVEAHLPNFEEKDINVQVDGDTLVISASRHEKEEDKDKKYVVRESSASFYRRFTLPERANADSIDANLKEGVLKVAVSLTPLPEPHMIAISAKK